MKRNENDNKILFLCTGNYYRSRFSEHLFNALARKNQLNWRAESRGLAIERGENNVGAISPYAVFGLKRLGLTVPPDERLPIQVREGDFVAADKIIVLDKNEHYPIMVKRFPQWVEMVEYWLVHDLDQTSPILALKQMEQQIKQLVKDLIP